MNLNINDTVSWSSAAGDMEGVITNICLSQNAALQTVPWMDIKVDEVNGHVISVRLCATNLNLRMMRVTKVELVAA